MLYTINPSKDEYRISKFDSNFDVIDSYIIRTTKNGRFRSCSCPAGFYNRPCKHIRIFQSFAENKRIGTGWFLEPTHAHWVDPISL